MKKFCNDDKLNRFLNEKAKNWTELYRYLRDASILRIVNSVFETKKYVEIYQNGEWYFVEVKGSPKCMVRETIDRFSEYIASVLIESNESER